MVQPLPEHQTPKNGEPLPTDAPHQVRQVLGGLIAMAIGVYDAWWKSGEHQGFDISFDTVLIMTGLFLISGVRTVVPPRGTAPTPPTSVEPK